MKYLKPLSLMALTIWAVFVVLRWLDLMDTYRSGTWALQYWIQELDSWVQYVGTPWGLALWIFLTGYVIGCWVLSALTIRGDSLRDDLIATGLGVGVLSTVVYVFGLLSFALSVVFFVGGLVVCSAGFRHVGRLWHRLKQSVRGIVAWNWHDKVLLGVILWYIARTCLVVCNPATGWDECNSHLAMAKWYARAGSIEFLPWMNFNNFPMGLESLLMLQFMGTETPGAVIPYMFHLLTLCVVYLLGCYMVTEISVTATWCRVGGKPYLGIDPAASEEKQIRTGGLLACLIYLMIPATTMYSQSVLTDSMLVFYACLLGWLVTSHHQPRLSPLVGGLIIGILVSVKYTGLIWAGIMVLVLGLHWTAWKGVSLKGRVKDVLLFILGLFAMCAPWLIRNVYIFGNPVFPFLDTYFSWTGTIAPHLRADLVIEHSSMLESFRVEQPLVAAWTNTMEEHGAWIRGVKPGSSGPWLLALVPAIALSWRSLSVGLRWLVVASVLYLAVWWLGLRIDETRYLLPAAPALCAAAGVGVSKLLEGD